MGATVPRQIRHTLAQGVRTVSPMEWVCLVCGLGLTLHYAWLMDDAFVYFRYVDNCLFLGYGLVYNAGEYVEGYSSPLWALVLLALRSLHANYWLLTCALGVVSYTAFWLIAVLLNRKLSPPEVTSVNVPLALLTGNYAVATYFTSGLETPLIQVYAGLYALFLILSASNALALLLAFSPMVRPELTLPLGLCVLWSWYRTRRFPLVLVGASFVVNSVWLLFRIYYYADLFPNTFYLKNIPLARQGLVYVGDTFFPYHIPELAAVSVLALLVLRRWRTAENPLHVAERLAMLAVALPVLLYVIRIGGDPRHYRYLAFPFCLIVFSSAGIAEHFVRPVVRSWRLPLASTLTLTLLITALFFHPHQQPDYVPLIPGRTIQYAKINDAEYHRDISSQRSEGSPWGIAKDPNWAYYQTHGVVDAEQPYTGVIAGSLCVDLYYAPQDRIVQDLGLTEPILARTEMKSDRAAHKRGLQPLGVDLRDLLERYNNAPHRGFYRRAVADGVAPEWIVNNLASIEVIEKKMCNHHDLRENIALAFAFPPKIVP